MNKIEVTYCSNYNGCYMRGDIKGKMTDLDYTEYKDQANECIDTIVNKAVEEVSEDGEFYGDIDELEEFCVSTVKKVFGESVHVTFDEDSISS